MPNIRDRIRTYRETHNTNQQQLADLLGVTRQCVSYWENGRTKPNITQILKLAAILQIPVEQALRELHE